MNAVKIICMFPLMSIAYPFGFVFQSLRVGFYAGQCVVNNTSKECVRILDAKKAKHTAK